MINGRGICAVQSFWHKGIGIGLLGSKKGEKKRKEAGKHEDKKHDLVREKRDQKRYGHVALWLIPAERDLQNSASSQAQHKYVQN